MIEHEMIISGKAGEQPKLVLVPPTGAEFDPLAITVPQLFYTTRDEVQKPLGDFTVECASQVRRACSNKACQSVLRWVTSGKMNGEPDEVIIQGATIQCKSESCPLNEGGGESGDREPRITPPDPSTLETAQVVRTGFAG